MHAQESFLTRDGRELAWSFTITAGLLAANRVACTMCKFLILPNSALSALSIPSTPDAPDVPGSPGSLYSHPCWSGHTALDIPTKIIWPRKSHKVVAFTCFQHSGFRYLDSQGVKVEEPCKETTLCCARRWERD